MKAPFGSRARRVGAALLVALMVGSLLAVSGLATAANTAVEGNVADGERRIAGANRYDTAVKVAELAIEAGVDSPTEVLVVSGVNFAEAVSATAVSAERDAPILLTDPKKLPSGVRSFIRRHEVQEVTIVGGTEAVSEDVAEALSALRTVETVTRIAGDDRYETAVAVAETLDVPGSFCDGDGAAVILVNGESRVDGVAASPAAYAMQLPVLFSLTDELHPAVADYLKSAVIDEAILLGSEAELGNNLLDELEFADVTVTRIEGADVYARSVALAQRLAECSEISVAHNQWALLDAEVPVDGVTASGLLANGAGQEAAEGALVPVLLVADPLPEVVRSFLASTPVRRGTAYQNATLHALGGTGRISAELMAAALSAAVTSKPLTATISAKAGSGTFTVRYSAPVDEASATSKSNYQLSGKPLINGDTITIDDPAETVTITLDQDKLLPGDTISVVGGKVRGAGAGRLADLRTVGATTFTVPAPIREKIRPTVTIIAPAGQALAYVRVTEANPSDSTLPGSATDVSDGLNASEVTITAGGDTLRVNRDSAEPNPHGIKVVYRNANSYEVYWGCDSTALDAPDVDHGITDFAALCTGTALAADDRVEVKQRAIVDAAGNTSRSASTKVKAIDANIQLDGSPTLTAPTAGKNLAGTELNGMATISVGGTDLAQLVVRPGSPYTGLSSTMWQIRLNYKADGDDDDNDEPTVTVDVNPRREDVTITIDDDATVPDLVSALQSSAALTTNFAVIPLATEAAQLSGPIGGAAFAQGPILSEFTGAFDSAILTLRFKDALASFDLAAFLAGQPEGSLLSPDTDTVESAAELVPAELPTHEVRIQYIYNALPVPEKGLLLNLPAEVASNGARPGTNVEKSDVEVSIIDGVSLRLDIEALEHERRRPVAPVAGRVDRSTLDGILAEAADRRAQNAFELAFGYWDSTVGIDSAGMLRGLSGFETDVSSCPANWDSMGVTDTEIRIGLSAARTQAGSSTNLATRRYVQGWEDYFKWVNENDPIMIDGTKRNLKLVFKDDNGDRSTAVSNVGELVSENVLSITTSHPSATSRVTGTINSNCVPHVFNGRRHSDVGNLADNPWTTGMAPTWYTQGYLMGARLAEHFDDNEKLVVLIVIKTDNAQLVNMKQGLDQWISENRGRLSTHRQGRLQTHEHTNDNVQLHLENFLRRNQGGSRSTNSAVNAVLVLSEGIGCVTAPSFLRPVEHRYLTLGEHGQVIVAEQCAHPNTSWEDVTNMLGLDLMTAFRDYFKPIDTAKTSDPFLTHTRTRFAAVAGRASTDDMNLFGEGYASAYPTVEAIRIAAQLPGGVSRSNFMLAVRSLDLHHPLLLDGIDFEMDGTDDAFPVEGGRHWEFDAAELEWEEPTVLDVNGNTPVCDPNNAGKCQ